MEKHDRNVTNVLSEDGVSNVIIGDLENVTTTNIDELTTQMGSGSWAARLVYNNRFGGVLIQQQPGEGNRLHFHPDADECWGIISGNWEWYIEGEGTKRVKRNDIIVVNPNLTKVKTAGIIGNSGTLLSLLSFILTSIIVITNN